MQPAEVRHRPRKRFGQHFLHDPNVIRRLVAAIAPQPGGPLVEIGPGRGALTDALLAAGAEVLGIEIDRDLAALLRQRYAHHPGFSLVEADALRFDYRQLPTAGGRLRLVGNLPYNLSTPLLFALLGQRDCISDMHFMLQREVVERLAAQPGGKTYGRLSVMIQYHCEVEALFAVPPTAFTPPPRVESAVVRLRPRAAADPVATDLGGLERLVNRCFQQRRKTLRNCLKGLLPDAALAQLAVPLDVRPDTLSVADFVRLSNRIEARP